MSTVNLDYISTDNQQIGRLINVLGEILMSENIGFYQQVIMKNFDFNKQFSPDEEKDFLKNLYNALLDKLKELKFD